MVVISRSMCSVDCTVVEMAHESSILQRATREVRAYACLASWCRRLYMYSPCLRRHRVFCQPTGDFFGLLLRRCTEGVVYVRLGVTGASDALIKDDFRFADSAGFFRGVSCAEEDCSCFQSSTLTVTLAPLLFSETGDRCRALARLSLPLGDVAPPRPPAPADFSLPLPLFPDLPELFLGVGLIVSSAYAKSMAPAFGSMSSPPFTLHEIEQ